MASRDGVILEVAGLTRHFGALAALTDVSFTVRDREVFSVIGPNGAGKSTLFNVISGLHLPTAGRGVVGGPLSRVRAAVAAALGWLLAGV